MNCKSMVRIKLVMSYLNNAVLWWSATLSLEHGVNAGTHGHRHGFFATEMMKKFSIIIYTVGI